MGQLSAGTIVMNFLGGAAAAPRGAVAYQPRTNFVIWERP